MNASRRQFLRRTGLCGGALAFHPFLLNRQLSAIERKDHKKLLFIFQRGGNDGINTVIPRGDPEYNEQNRPSLYIPEAAGLDLGNGFAQLHPALAPMMRLYHAPQLTGTAGPGNLAVIHRVGYAKQSRSHFDNQEGWEESWPRHSAILGNEARETSAHPNPYIPENGAVYPGGDFGNKLREAARLVKNTPVRVARVNLAGFDTHSHQGSENGKHARLLAVLAQGFAALYLDLQDHWQDVMVVTMTEFGRTSKENGGGGTDHGEASTMFVAGGGVKGGVYNCDARSWKDGDMFSKRGRYLARRTEVSAVVGEISTNHFAGDPGSLDTILPGYSEAATAMPDDFTSLGFL